MWAPAPFQSPWSTKTVTKRPQCYRHKTWIHVCRSRQQIDITWIGFGSKESTTPAISVIRCSQRDPSAIKLETQIASHHIREVWNRQSNHKSFWVRHYLKYVARNPQLVTSRDANTRPYLKLPLQHAWHCPEVTTSARRPTFNTIKGLQFTWPGMTSPLMPLMSIPA